MLKKYLLMAVLAVAGVAPAHADQPTFEVAYDTFTTYGVWVTSGNAREVTDWTTLGDPGFKPSKIAGYRIQNQGATSLWLGAAKVSSDTASGADLTDLGTKLDSDDSVVEQVGYHTDSGQAEIYAIAEDSGGATQLAVSVTVYGAQ